MRLQAELREAHRREDIEALKSRLESEKIWAGNEVKKLRLKKEAELELSRIHLDQAVSSGQCYFSCDFLVIVIVKVIIFQVFQLQF